MQLGVNTIGVAQNTLKQSNFTLRQAAVDDIATNKNSNQVNSFDTANFDKMKEMLNTTIGDADFDYTKEDAIQAAWNKENALNINLNEDISGKVIGLGTRNPPADFVEKLEQNNISNEIDWFMKDFNFKNLNADRIKQSIDFLSSQYAVMKEHINQSFTGEELENQLNKLNETVTTHKNTIANAFADKVGGFLEDNGSLGEKDKIFNSMINEFDSKVKEYETFMQKNRDYAGIEGTKDKWLKNDTNFMASELRKAISTSSDVKTASANNGESYSLEELQTVGDMVAEIKSYDFGAHDRNRTKEGSDEKIGLHLAELTLKTEVFNKNASIADSLKNALSNSVDHFIKDTIESIDTEYKRSSDKAMIAADKKGYAPLDKNAIYGVIDKVMESYKKTGSASKAMKDGAEYAVDKFNSKRNDNGEVYRYKGDAFRNFYSLSKPEPIFNMKPMPYYEEKTGLEDMISSFNSFIDEFSLGNQNHINKSEFSALA